MAKWGLTNPQLEPFEFGRGWALEKFTIEMVEPRYMPLIGYPEAWSPSTSGEVVAPVVIVAGKTPDEVVAMKGSLKGAAVLQQAPVTNFIRGDRVQPADVSEAENRRRRPRPRRAGRLVPRAPAVAVAVADAARAAAVAACRAGATLTVATTIGTSGAAVLLKAEPRRARHGLRPGRESSCGGGRTAAEGRCSSASTTT